MNPNVGRALIVAGILLVVVGVVVKLNLLPWLGKLPGDIRIERENFRFYFPVTTSVLVSLLLSLIFYMFRR